MPIRRSAYASRGFVTYGRLWEALFQIEPRDEHENDDYKIIANVTDGWQDNSEASEIVLTPTVAGLPFDSKPVPRKTGTHRFWQLSFTEPEVVTSVTLDVDQHLEHYIIAPGGRDAFGQDVRFMYSFDIAAEQWTATTFPELRRPMFNMDAKIVELADKTHQLIVLSGEMSSGISGDIQGYNFEKDFVNSVQSLGVSFAGRPALSGDPMLRNSNNANTPDGEWDFSRSVIAVGGSSNSIFVRATSTQAHDSVLFSIQGSTLNVGAPWEIRAQGGNFTATGHTGLPFGFFNVTSNLNPMGGVETKLRNLLTYTRHQNLPVRGILRRRPIGNTAMSSASNPVVDFLLMGGFNIVGRENYNTSVVSGIFGNFSDAGGATRYVMQVPNPHFHHAQNSDHLLYFPDCDRVLGDCCAEYYAQRDEVICFGGRAHETDTAFAWATPAVLGFAPAPSNTPRWNYTKYPPQPNPRWSAASVLIRGLIRKGETIPCDRIFIIGGRNREGFVAAVDVLNLSSNDWETDWKGLLDGELETVPPSMGGGGTTIIGGSCNCRPISSAVMRQMLEENGF